MSKTSRTTYKNKETDEHKGKLSYRERLAAEELAAKEIEEFEIEQKRMSEDTVKYYKFREEGYE